MGFRVRKSIKLAPGVRMTMTPKSVGLSAGPRGARISANTRGRVTRSVGIPGSGISHVSSSSLKSGRSQGVVSRAPKNAPAPTVDAPAPKPGMLAPRWEKELHRSLVAKPDAAGLVKTAEAHPEAQKIAGLFETVRYAVPGEHYDRARRLIEMVFKTGFDPAADPFICKYMPDSTMGLSLTDQVSVTVQVDRDALGLLLAELRQINDDLTGAIEIVEGLNPTTVTATSLAELYCENGQWEEVVALTDNLRNEDDLTAYLLIQRGIAFREQGFPVAAREAFKEALRVRSRPAELRHLALLERGKTNLADRKKSMARKDFERIIAENSQYPGLDTLLTESTS